LRSIENDINCEGKRRGVAVYLKGSLKADGIEANHRQGLWVIREGHMKEVAHEACSQDSSFCSSMEEEKG
jgi:hypothetical protein